MADQEEPLPLCVRCCHVIAQATKQLVVPNVGRIHLACVREHELWELGLEALWPEAKALKLQAFGVSKEMATALGIPKEFLDVPCEVYDKLGSTAATVTAKYTELPPAPMHELIEKHPEPWTTRAGSTCLWNLGVEKTPPNCIVHDHRKTSGVAGPKSQEEWNNLFQQKPLPGDCPMCFAPLTPNTMHCPGCGWDEDPAKQRPRSFKSYAEMGKNWGPSPLQRLRAPYQRHQDTIDKLKRVEKVNALIREGRFAVPLDDLPPDESSIMGIPVKVDPSVPKGEARFVDDKGQVVGKIVGIGPNPEATNWENVKMVIGIDWAKDAFPSITVFQHHTAAVKRAEAEPSPPINKCAVCWAEKNEGACQHLVGSTTPHCTQCKQAMVECKSAVANRTDWWCKTPSCGLTGITHLIVEE